MTPGLLDHLLALALAVVTPIAGASSRRAMERLIAERGPSAKRIIYVRTMASQWASAAATILLWVLTARSWTALGISRPAGWGFVITLALAAAVLGYFAWQLYLVHHRPDVAAKARESAAALSFLAPTTPADMRLFGSLCITAGIVEELIYRGFLVWYLSAAMPLWAAAGVSSVVFGVGHVYQGRAAGFQTGALALLMSGVYVVAGSLWVPMLLHGAFNYLQVRMMYDAAQLAPSAPGEPATPVEPATHEAPTAGT